MKPWACLENLIPAPLNTPGGIIQGQFFKLIIKTYVDTVKLQVLTHLL